MKLVSKAASGNPAASSVIPRLRKVEWEKPFNGGHQFIQEHLPRIRLRVLVNDYLKMAMEFNQWFAGIRAVELQGEVVHGH
jgi:hypothetical protein